MTVRPMVKRIYIPSVGQPDAQDRATALSAILVENTILEDSRYSTRVTQTPAVVLDFGYELVIVNEPTTHAAVDAAQDEVLEELVPATVARVSDIVTTVGTELTTGLAAHSAASNPHGITPASIGAAPASHGTHGTQPHSHIAADLPASLEESSEILQVVAAHEALGNPHPGYASDADLSTHASGLHAGHAASVHSHTGLPISIHKPSDQGLTGTGAVDIAGLSFAVEANSTYIFYMEVDLTAAGGTSPTHNYQFTGPASPDRVSIKRTQMTSATAVATSVVTAFGTGFGAGATVANTKHIFEGSIKTGANAGTVQLRVTPAGTTPTATVGRGSGGYAMKVA